jgi:hypothetical protein
MGYFYDTYVKNPLVKENAFITASAEIAELPCYEAVHEKIPKPFWQNHDSTIKCYWKAWELAFTNLKKTTKENGFVANYIATCFNDCLFMWDSVFSLMYGKYGSRAFNFQHTLDNLYAKQHPDGFICREIAEADGTDRFHRYDPSSTGPNVMPWAEWEYYKIFGDKERLRAVFPVLAAYHRWLRSYRTWPDGTYWSSGWGCGMDNQPRLPKGMHNEFYHGHTVWLDICLQQVFSAKILVGIAELLGRNSEISDFNEEISRLTEFINNRLWDEETGFYFDLHPDNKRSNVKTIGAYWALIAGIVPENRLARFIAHLDNPLEFKAHHRVPSLSMDNPGFSPEGDYWKGGVWVLTNYMVLRGLTKMNCDDLAHEIACNHVGNVVKVFEDTGTLWENYSPAESKQGKPAQPNFVGFGGLPPIAVLFEYVFGLRPDVGSMSLLWDIRCLEEHGVIDYPFGNAGNISIKCKARSSGEERPEIEISSNIDLKVEVRWNNGKSKEFIFLQGR